MIALNLPRAVDRTFAQELRVGRVRDFRVLVEEINVQDEGELLREVRPEQIQAESRAAPQHKPEVSLDLSDQMDQVDWAIGITGAIMVGVAFLGYSYFSILIGTKMKQGGCRVS